jgi:type II secretory pathway pseudopilin PulG
MAALVKKNDRGKNRRLAKVIIAAREQRGLGLVETLVAIALLGTSVVAFVTALSSGSIAAGEQERETIAQSLAQTQVEYTKSYPYNPAATTYPTVTAPAGYAVSVGVGSVPGTDINIQKITVTIRWDGLSILTVADYKVNR